MKIKWWLLAFLMLSIGLNVGVLTTVAIQKKHDRKQLQDPPKPSLERNRLAETRFNRLADALELEGPDREAFIQQQVLFAQEFEESRFHLRRAHAELRDLLVDPEADAATALKASEEAGRAYGEMDALLVKHVFKVRELLTPEQVSAYVRILNRIGPRVKGQSQPGRGARPLAEEGVRARPRRHPEGMNRPKGQRRPIKGREGGPPPPQREDKTSGRRELGPQ